MDFRSQKQRKRKKKMKIEEGKIMILINPESIVIELEDDKARVRIAKIELDAIEFTKALSRRCASCKNITVYDNCKKYNKTHQSDIFTFPMPDGCKPGDKELKTLAYAEALRLCPDGWEVSDYFGSSDSFFNKDGRLFARAIIRRWTD
jgi:hypothetical protein